MTFPPKDRRRPGQAGGNGDDNNPDKKRPASASRPGPPSVAEEAQRKFGATIQRLRQQSGLSQDQLGHDSGITGTEMKEIEAGRMDTALFTIIRLASRLGATVEELLQGIP
ncbi:MAG TPA: helix-turn-helix transcriptional regulator [Candidatus Angelobacter sp.]